MAKLVQGGDRNVFDTQFLGKRFTCTSTKNVYQIDESDRSTFQKRIIGAGRDDTDALCILCPDCNGKVYPGSGHMPARSGYRD